jgi:flagellar biosynthesis protein
VQRKRAVALRYDQARESAPRVVAKGAGAVAEAIVRAAAAADVSIVRNPELTEALLALELDSVIPEELYAVVAEVLAFVYRAKRHETADGPNR